MSNNDCRSIPDQVADCSLDQAFRFSVERRRRLIQNQDWRINQDCTCDSKPLALTARKKDAALADNRIVPLGQFANEFVRKSDQGGLFDLPVARLRSAVRDVVADRIVEKYGLLSDQCNLPSQAGTRDVSYIDAIPQHRARARIVKPWQQLRQSGLPTARLAHQSYHRTCWYLQTHVTQDAPRFDRVTKSKF